MLSSLELASQALSSEAVQTSYSCDPRRVPGSIPVRCISWWYRGTLAWQCRWWVFHPMTNRQENDGTLGISVLIPRQLVWSPTPWIEQGLTIATGWIEKKPTWVRSNSSNKEWQTCSSFGSTASIRAWMTPLVLWSRMLARPASQWSVPRKVALSLNGKGCLSINCSAKAENLLSRAGSSAGFWSKMVMISLQRARIVTFGLTLPVSCSRPAASRSSFWAWLRTPFVNPFTAETCFLSHFFFFWKMHKDLSCPLRTLAALMNLRSSALVFSAPSG